MPVRSEDAGGKPERCPVSLGWLGVEALERYCEQSARARTMTARQKEVQPL